MSCPDLLHTASYRYHVITYSTLPPTDAMSLLALEGGDCEEGMFEFAEFLQVFPNKRPLRCVYSPRVHFTEFLQVPLKIPNPVSCPICLQIPILLMKKKSEKKPLLCLEGEIVPDGFE